MKLKYKNARVVEKYKVMCPHCLKVRDASVWAIAHYNIEIIFTCSDCGRKSIIKPHQLGRD